MGTERRGGEEGTGCEASWRRGKEEGSSVDWVRTVSFLRSVWVVVPLPRHVEPLMRGASRKGSGLHESH